MNRFGRKLRKAIMPSAYVTYEPPGKENFQLEVANANVNVKATAAALNGKTKGLVPNAAPTILPSVKASLETIMPVEETSKKSRLDSWLSQSSEQRVPKKDDTGTKTINRQNVRKPAESANRTRPRTSRSASRISMSNDSPSSASEMTTPSVSSGLLGGRSSSSSSSIPMQNHYQNSSFHASASTSNMAASNVGGISRRKIISKSQEAGLNDDQQIQEEEDDVWYDQDALFRHHLREVLDKWSSIDDEIWGKIICMEKNRRVAKAYARVPVLTINGGDDGFDGYRIGLGGFDNPRRDADIEEVKKHIGQGIKLKMDNDGNILVKRASTSQVFIRNTSGNNQDDNCFSTDVARLQGQIDCEKPFKVFDMKKFTANIAREMKNGAAYADRRKLELQCFTNIAFVQQEPEHLETPCWLMVINIVALDMLKNKLPQTAASGVRSGLRMPAMMENVQATRFLSTPRDEHYPRLVHQMQQQQHSMADLSLPENNEFADDMDDRASVATYNYNPNASSASSGYRSGTPSYTAADYADLLPHHGHHPSHRPPLQDALCRSWQQQHPRLYIDPYYDLGPEASPAMAAAYRASLGHALTEPNFNARESRRNFTTPSLQRFAAQNRHSRSYDSGLESDMTSSSDETDYNRWTSYNRLQMMPRSQRVPEWN